MKALLNLFRRPKVTNRPGQVATLTWDPGDDTVKLTGWHIDAAGGGVTSALVAIAHLLNDIAAETRRKGVPVEVKFGDGVRLNGEPLEPGAYRVKP